LVIDCHSYPAEPLVLDLDRRTPRPDACLGTAGLHTPAWLVDAGRRWAAAQGWSLGIDAPYAGSIVPMKHFGHDPRVASVMVEINRARYMRLDGTRAHRTEGFADARAFAAGMVVSLRGAMASG
jgi:N-formylglutamate amidohydrolase